MTPDSRRAYFRAYYHQQCAKRRAAGKCVICGGVIDAPHRSPSRCKSCLDYVCKITLRRYYEVKAPPIQQVKCKQCGEGFTVRGRRKCYCSPVCMRKWWTKSLRNDIACTGLMAVVMVGIGLYFI